MLTKYVIKSNKPLSDLDDDEMLHLLIVPAKNERRCVHDQIQQIGWLRKDSAVSYS